LTAIIKFEQALSNKNSFDFFGIFCISTTLQKILDSPLNFLKKELKLASFQKKK
jgi:hypothetical protein